MRGKPQAVRSAQSWHGAVRVPLLHNLPTGKRLRGSTRCQCLCGARDGSPTAGWRRAEGFPLATQRASQALRCRRSCTRLSRTTVPGRRRGSAVSRCCRTRSARRKVLKILVDVLGSTTKVSPSINGRTRFVPPAREARMCRDTDLSLLSRQR
eukprot:4412857-Prymnesium_polylepis.1